MIRSEVGAALFRENDIPDPALNMGRRLADELRRRYSLKVEQQALYVSDDDPKQITARNPDADVILDVGISNMKLEAFSNDSPGYVLRYVAYVRLIDAKVVHAIDGSKGTVVADGRCVRSPEEKPNAPTYADFVAAEAERLKQELDIAAQFCVDEFLAKVLTASPTP